MAGSQGLFTLKEAAYLRSLPAVKEVSATRITYSDQFKIECVRRYLKGESARKIFRDAGLDPSLIGAKRIERCVARWKTTKYIVDEAARIDANDGGENSADATSSERNGCIDAKSVLDSYNIANAAFAAISTSKSCREIFDVRDLIIYQQVQQIATLQEKVAELQRRIEQLGGAADVTGMLGVDDTALTADWKD
ncbi:HTH domain-containing protein [Bifidobacterium moukalabense]|uniref:HTH domain-containing protein n=1 Tax=Bifidobacterium moukalabense TaxID=1333651 RepID=UPI001FCE8198|nr:HTH domain-containing protein [Bifidobacterium moukalabense]